MAVSRRFLVEMELFRSVSNQSRNRFFLFTEKQEQFKGIPIGSDGVPADILLYGKIVRQERGKVHGEISRFHRKSPPFPE